METTNKLSSLFCFSFFFFLLFTINQTISESDHMDTFCIKSSGTFTRNSTYNTNLNTMLSTFRNQSSIVNYYNLTTGLASDTVHGMYLCTGDVNITTCNTCIKAATQEIVKNCTNHREAIIYYLDCMVRYSDKFFLTTLETKPSSTWVSDEPVPKSVGPFTEILTQKMGEVIVRASMLSSAFTPYYYLDTTRFHSSYDLESVAQCSPHLDQGNCTTCLNLALQEIVEYSDHLWAITFTPKCLVYFEITTSSLPPLPSPNHSGSFSIKGNNEVFWGMVAAASMSILLNL